MLELTESMLSSCEEIRPKYIAVLSNVKETALLGTSNLSYWKERLRAEGLAPINYDENAHILISAVEAQFRGIKFREICISVFAQAEESNNGSEGLYFLCAFNTSRLFATIERLCFSTPHRFGVIKLEVGVPATIDLSENEELSFHAEMSASTVALPRQRLRCGEEWWSGPIFLTGMAGDRKQQGKLFYGKFGGHAEVYPFSPELDTLLINISHNQSALQCINEAGFFGKEWIIRENSTHSRTKTYQRRIS